MSKSTGKDVDDDNDSDLGDVVQEAILSRVTGRTHIPTREFIERLRKLTKDGYHWWNRSAHEKNVKTWVQSTADTVCLTCFREFTICRYNHHCRICGENVCYNCLKFLPFAYVGYACKLAQLDKKEPRLNLSKTLLNAHTVNKTWFETWLRCCRICHESVEGLVGEMIETKNYYELLYEAMKVTAKEVTGREQLLFKYNTITKRLWDGEPITQKCNVALALSFHDQIMQKILYVTKLGNEIITMADQNLNVDLEKVKRLKRRIRQEQHDMRKAMSDVPSEDEYNEIVERRANITAE